MKRTQYIGIILNVFFFLLLVFCYHINYDFASFFPLSRWDSGRFKIYICSPICVIWNLIPVWYGIIMLINMIFQKYLKITDILFWLTFLIMIFYSFGDEPYLRLVSIGIMGLGFLLWILSKSEYERTSFKNICIKNIKNNKFYIGIIIFFTIIIVTNIIYICVPKRQIYIYVISENGEELIYETDNLIFEEISRIDLLQLSNDYAPFRAGWLIKADSTGMATLQIKHISGTGEESYEEKTITVNKMLKFKNELSLDYILHIYWENIFFIALGIAAILFVIRVCITKKEFIKKNTM